jgi:tetratricopeptide (TPR) repeat protein
MGQVWVTLGEPKQRAKYYGKSEVRPMEIWFYDNAHRALPPFFYVVFFDKNNNGDMKLYSPYMDGPATIATSVMGANDNARSIQAIDRALGREVARTTLSLLPDEPVDINNPRPSLQSDVMLGIITDLRNHPFTKEELKQRRLLEETSSRVVLADEFLDVLAVPLRDAAGNPNLHYLLRLRNPGDFAVQRTDDKTSFSIECTAGVYDAQNHLIFRQEKSVAKYLSKDDLDRLKQSSFGYEGWLPLEPGKYRVEFLLSNKVTKTAYRATRDIAIPRPAATGLFVPELVAFSTAEAVGPGHDYLPFTVGGVRFTPLAGEGLTIAPGTSLNVMYQIWAPPADPYTYAGQKIAVEYRYGRLGVAGDPKIIHDEFERQQFDAFGSLLTGKKLPLTDAPPGNYRLLVSVQLPEQPQKIFASLSFRIGGSNTAFPAPPFDVTADDAAADLQNGVPEFERGLTALAQHDEQSATAWFAAAFRKNPGNESARARLMELYFARKDYARAAALFSGSPVTAQTDDQTVLLGAESFSKNGDLARAIGLLEQSISLHSSSGPLYLALANYYREQGNVTKAGELESKGRSLSRP